jgi:F-type H+-transporting ATPase subunit gamma
MESPQNIKKRLKSVKNINQITKAMELVSATKMRKSQQIALDSRPYAFMALDLLANVSLLENKLPELLQARKNIKRVLFVLVASDKGLAGAFNSSVFKKFEAYIKNEKEEWKTEEHFFVAVGEKANAYLQKRFPAQGGSASGGKVEKKFVHAGDFTTTEQVKPLADFIVEGYLKKEWDRVVVISTHFKSALRQEAHIKRILPVDFEHIKETVLETIPERGKFADLIKEQNINFVGMEKEKNPTSPRLRRARYTIEPSPEKVLEKLAEHLLFMEVYQLILEANASEHSARRIAMKTASDNANDLGQKLNLQYNKSRQSRITTEISEISAGAEALQ